MAKYQRLEVLKYWLISLIVLRLISYSGLLLSNL